VDGVKDTGTPIALGLSLGAAFGIVFGLLMNNLALGLSLGIAIGVAMGASGISARRAKRDDRPGTTDPQPGPDHKS
jgi:hypothetical protein